MFGGGRGEGWQINTITQSLGSRFKSSNTTKVEVGVAQHPKMQGCCYNRCAIGFRGSEAAAPQDTGVPMERTGGAAPTHEGLHQVVEGGSNKADHQHPFRGTKPGCRATRAPARCPGVRQYPTSLLQAAPAWRQVGTRVKPKRQSVALTHSNEDRGQVPSAPAQRPVQLPPSHTRSQGPAAGPATCILTISSLLRTCLASVPTPYGQWSPLENPWPLGGAAGGRHHPYSEASDAAELGLSAAPRSLPFLGSCFSVSVRLEICPSAFFLFPILKGNIAHIDAFKFSVCEFWLHFSRHVSMRLVHGHLGVNAPEPHSFWWTDPPPAAKASRPAPPLAL